MLIGVNKLDSGRGSIDMPGLYVMAMPAFPFAKAIVLQTVINNPSVKIALISFEDRNGLFNTTPETNEKLFEIYNSGNLSLNVVSTDGDKNLFSNITGEFEREPFISVDLILINIGQDIFTLISDDELSVMLSAWQSWLVRHKKTCIWVIHGGMSANYLKNKFLKLNNIFNGLVNIISDAYETMYDIVFWHSRSSVQSNILLNISLDETNSEISIIDGNEFSESSRSTVMHRGPSNRVLVIKSNVEEHEILPHEWGVLYSLDELGSDNAGNIATATIIIYINSNVDVNFLAHKIIELRKKHGGGIKIIIREMERCLRDGEEKLVINSGANLVIPHGVVFSRFLAIVYAIQGSYLVRNIPNSIEDIFRVNSDKYGKSYFSLKDFVRQVISLTDSARRVGVDASMVKLTLNPAIPVEEIAALLKIKRNVDIFTFTKDHLYLFLFQCGQSELPKVLAQLFGLPIEDLFLGQELFCYLDEIINEIKNIPDLDNDVEGTQKNRMHSISEVSQDVNKRARKSAVSMPLELKRG